MIHGRSRAGRRRAGVLLIAGLVAGCGRRDQPGKAAGDALYAPVPVSIARPDFTLFDTDGRPFAFRARTAGTLTFLFFGYTHCPDVCPVHMANIAAALRTLSYDERQRVRVVFVTVDPARDSATVVRRWLDAFDPSFIGLRGSIAAVTSAEATLGLGPAVFGAADSTGAYVVGHAAPVVLFSPDDTAHAMYPFGTRQADWVKIIPEQLRRAVASGPPIRVERAVFVLPIGDAPAALYFTVRNTGAAADTLVGLTVDGADKTSMHNSEQHQMPAGAMGMSAMTMMVSVASVPVVAGGEVRFAPGGLHGMVERMRRPLTRGDTVRLTVRLARGQSVSATARVIAYADLDTAIAPTSRR